MDRSLNTSVSRQSLKPSNRLNISGALNRSRSASRLSPSLLCPGIKPASRSKSPSRRSKTPTRINSTSGLGNISNAGQYNGRKSQGADRFIPNRSTTDIEYAQHSLVSDNTDSVDNLSAAMYDKMKMMEENLKPGDNSRILSFKSKAPVAKDGHLNNMKVLYSAGKPAAPKAANSRNIPSTPEKILDAPDMVNDFYLHLMDWSKSNHMAVALSAGVYIWNAADGSIIQLCQKELEEDYVSAVSWMTAGNILAVGDSQGQVQLWDVASSKLMRSMDGHRDRVGCLDWNQHLVASGGRDGLVILHDVRVAEHQVARLAGHQQEVCGLAWAGDGKTLASGGNDNIVQVWQLGREAPLHSITQHQSAVKALSWCPWQAGVLATAGGTVDRTIRVWQTSTMTQLSSTDTGSQVSSIVWNSAYRELVTGHGFSHNQLTIWKYPKAGGETLMKVGDLTGHTSRVLLLCTSPDSSMVASVAADETIRLWKVWPELEKKKKVYKVELDPKKMEEIDFPIDYLLKFIVDKEWSNVNASMKDLESPTGPFVQTIFFKILSDFNFSETMVNTHQPEFDILEELGEHAAMYQEVLPVITLQAAMQSLLTSIMGDQHNFGLYDLISPTPRRFRKFLSILVNFYNFSDLEYGKIEAVKASVDKMVQTRKDLAEKNEDLRNKINYKKSKAVEEAAEEEALRQEDNNLKLKLEEMTEEHRRIQAIKNQEKQRFEDEEKKTKELEEELRKLQNERDQIQAVVDGEAVMMRLDHELECLAEDLVIKEKNYVENRNRVEEVVRSNKECQSLLETVQKISDEKQRIKTISIDVEDIKKSIEKFSLEGKETERIRREEEVRVNEKLETLNKLKAQWSRRKEGKQEELDQAKEEMEEAKQDCSEEQQKALKIESELRDLELEYGDEQDGITEEARKVRLQYNKILENVNKYNEKMSRDLARLNDARDQLKQAKTKFSSV